MKLITIENIGFDLCDDPVRTEEIINHNLSKNLHKVSDDYVYFSFPLAWAINNYGLQQVQTLLNQINNSLKEKIVYVCQHIQVKNLDFGNNIVFSPHSTVFDKFIAIPHHAPNKSNDVVNFEDKKTLMSFVGSYSTHNTRKVIGDTLAGKENCISRDTGEWHFYKTGHDLNDSSDFYISTIKDSKMTICPRGTGPSTIRIWEAMAMSSVPVIISDSLQLPLSSEIDWSEHVILIPEKDSSLLFDHIPSDERLKKMSKNCFDTYNNFFSEDKMHEIIIGECDGKV